MRSWVVIPALAFLGGAAAILAQYPVSFACAVGSLAGTLALAIRAFAGPSAAAAVSAATGALLGVVGLMSLPDHGVRFAIGGAGAMLAISELARSASHNRAPLAAVAAAVIGTACDPAYAPLIVVTGVHVVVSRRPETRRWAFALPVVGLIAVAAAIWTATLGHGTTLWRVWFGFGDEPAAAAAAVDRIVDLLGPMAAFAGLTGLALCLARGRVAGIAVVAVVAMTAVIALPVAAIPPAVPIVAALCGGVGLARFAITTHSPIGQAFVGVTSGFMLVATATWRLVATM